MSAARIPVDKLAFVVSTLAAAERHTRHAQPGADTSLNLDISQAKAIITVWLMGAIPPLEVEVVEAKKATAEAVAFETAGHPL